jgi:hypothetical protein
MHTTLKIIVDMVRCIYGRNVKRGGPMVRGSGRTFPIRKFSCQNYGRNALCSAST